MKREEFIEGLYKDLEERKQAVEDFCKAVPQRIEYATIKASSIEDGYKIISFYVQKEIILGKPLIFKGMEVPVIKEYMKCPKCGSYMFLDFNGMDVCSNCYSQFSAKIYHRDDSGKVFVRLGYEDEIEKIREENREKEEKD